TERHWRRRGPIGWTIETDWQDNFNEESLEEAVRDWPTVVRQGRKPPLRRIDVKRRSYPDAKVMPHVEHQTRMYGKVGLPRGVLHPGNQFKIVSHTTFPLEGNSKGKANREIVSDVRRFASRMCDQWEYKTDMPAHSRLS